MTPSPRSQIRTTIPSTDLYIDGAFVPPCEQRTFPAYNPATGEILASVAEATAADVERAVRAASRAYQDCWSRLELQKRAAVLRRIADLIDDRVEELALLETLNSGKPLRDTRGGEIHEAAAWFRFFADIGQRLRSDVIPSITGYLNYTLREPYGVVGLIVPWNYPLVLAALKCAPALGVGNSVILKPAEETPLSALALAEICTEAGVPPGVFNVLPGYGESVGRAIVTHPDVKMISFTGSTPSGRDVLRCASEHVKPVTLELGGKSPSIVFADADLDAAAKTCLFSFCVNQGQLCAAGTRVLVERCVHDEFVELLLQHAQGLIIGDPREPETQLGSLINETQFNRVQGYVDSGVEAGELLLIGGRRYSVTGCEEGFFYGPTVFDRVDPHATIAQEEIFGPVVSILEFADETQAVAIANDVLYGLASSVWSSDLTRAHRMAARLEAGLVYVNTMNVTAPSSPYCGFKQSGFGYEGGTEQAESFTRAKSVWINLAAEAPSL